MSKDVQKPILFKCDPKNYVDLENLKIMDKWGFNRNRILNDSLRVFIELVNATHEFQNRVANGVDTDADKERVRRVVLKIFKKIIEDYPNHRFKESEK